MITDPDDALTAANACMQKHFIYDYVKTWLGEGLLTSSGKYPKESMDAILKLLHFFYNHFRPLQIFPFFFYNIDYEEAEIILKRGSKVCFGKFKLVGDLLTVGYNN